MRKIKIHIRNNHWKKGFLPCDQEGEEHSTITKEEFEKGLSKYPEIIDKIDYLVDWDDENFVPSMKDADILLGWHFPTKNLKEIDNIFKKFDKEYLLINLDISKFKNTINKTNQMGKEVTLNQMSNMANIRQSLLEAKKSEDLIYFVEDDYIHKKNSLSEMIFTYERIASQINNEIIICPTDYPYLYAKAEVTQNFLGDKFHWRKINESHKTNEWQIKLHRTI